MLVVTITNLLQSDANHKIASYLNSVTSSGSFCLIDKPTRLGKSSATLLDHFYTNNLTTPITSGILESDISDHLPIFVLIRSYTPPYSSTSYKFRRHLSKMTMSNSTMNYMTFYKINSPAMA